MRFVHRTLTTRGALARDKAFAALTALAIVVISYPGVVLMGGSLAPSDLGVIVDRSDYETTSSYVIEPLQFYGIQDLAAPLWQLEPATRYLADAIREGENPLWNPYSGSGTPALSTLADIKSSPFVIGTAVLGASVTAYTFLLLGTIVLGAFFIVDFLTTDLGLRRLSGALGGAVFVLNGFAVSYVVSQIAAPYFLFPPVLVALYRFVAHPSTSRLALAGLAHGLLFVTTFFPVVASVVLGAHVVAWTSLSCMSETPGGWARRLGTHARALAVGVGLAAVILVPIGSHLLSGSDVSSYQSRNLGDRSPWLAYGLGTRFHLWASFDGSDYPARLTGPVWTMYVGLTTTLSLFAGLRRDGGFRRLYAAAWSLVIAGIVMHTDLPWLGVLGELPLLRIVRPDYWASLIAIGLVIVVPLSLHRLAARGLNAFSLVVAGAALAFAYLSGYLYLRDELADGAGWRTLWMLSAIAVTVSILLVSARLTPQWTVWAAGVLIMIELLFSVNHVWPDRTELTKDPPTYVSFLESDGGESRVLNAGRTGLYPEWGSALGIEQLGTLNIGQDDIYADWFLSYVNPRRNLFLEVGRDQAADPDAILDHGAIDQLSVRFLVVEERMETYVSAIRDAYPERVFDEEARIYIFENEDAFPGAYLASTVHLTEDPLAYATTTDVALTTDEALFQKAVDAGVATSDHAGSLQGSEADIVERSNTRLAIEVDATRPGLLVVTDKWDEDWTATVDGERAEIARVNGPIRGVIVPEGRSRIEMTYQDDAVLLGTLVSLLTLASLATSGVLAQLVKRGSDLPQR